MAEIKMLRQMCALIKSDKLKNEYIKGNLSVMCIARKMKENRLKGYLHFERRHLEDTVKMKGEKSIKNNQARDTPNK